VVLFFPLSADPLRKIPRERLAIWPISERERLLLRILSPWLNPLTWILIILALRRSVTMGLWALVAGLFAAGFPGPVALPGTTQGNLAVADPFSGSAGSTDPQETCGKCSRRWIFTAD